MDEIEETCECCGNTCDNENQSELEDSNLVKHAINECAFMLEKDENGEVHEVNRWMYDHLIHMVREFSKEGHSGFTASYAINILKKLLNFEPVLPLQGTDDEWTDIGDNLFQNKRCSRIFKENGKAYDIQGKVFTDDGGSYTSKESMVYIDFPYTPKTEYIDLRGKK